jgi:hypothetical protein
MSLPHPPPERTFRPLEVLIMMREDIRRRALRAAAAVSLTLGVAGCTGHVETSPAGGEGGAVGMAGEGGAGGAGGAGVVADAGSDAYVYCSQYEPIAEWEACCDAYRSTHDAGWGPGCAPWGPPMPPAMPAVLS